MDKKLIVILGPTASGKTDLSIKLAKKFDGEIISADSRQIYKGLDIGTGKITKREMWGIPHHLLNIASPKRKFTVAQFQKLALKKIKEIQKRGKIPFLVGGTGLYIRSIVDGPKFPEVKPDWNFRQKMSKKSTGELFLMLKKIDPVRAKTIDSKNPRRLIRAIEIVENTVKPVPQYWDLRHPNTIGVSEIPISSNLLQIGVKKSPEELKKAIHKRLQKRLKQGMIDEVKNLHRNGLSWKRLEELGLEYRFAARYLQNKITCKEMTDALEKEIWQFSKRQMTWFKKDKRIQWIRNQREAEKLVKKFIS